MRGLRKMQGDEEEIQCKDCFLWHEGNMSPYEKEMYCSMRKCGKRG